MAVVGVQDKKAGPRIHRPRDQSRERLGPAISKEQIHAPRGNQLMNNKTKGEECRDVQDQVQQVPREEESGLNVGPEWCAAENVRVPEGKISTGQTFQRKPSPGNELVEHIAAGRQPLQEENPPVEQTDRAKEQTRNEPACGNLSEDHERSDCISCEVKIRGVLSLRCPEPAPSRACRLKSQASRLPPQVSRLKPQASSLKPQVSSLKPHASSLTPQAYFGG